VTRFPAALVLVVGLLPWRALAQQDLGLDLTDDSKKEKEQPATPKKEKPADKEPGSGPAEEESKAAAPTVANEEQAEREVILEDRVKSVQKKVYLKKNRFEISPMVGLSVNDPYYSKLTVTGFAAYYLADTLALAARGSWIQVVKTDDVRTAQHAFSSEIYHSDPQWSVTGDLLWSPIYGKATIFNSILHFDAYLLGGMGAVDTLTSSLEGPHVAFDLGVGLKFVAKDYLAVNAALINTTYVDTPSGTSQGITQNLMTLNIGVSLFIPFKSTGRESE
jgi:outer membrane beta-barrel protein